MPTPLQPDNRPSDVEYALMSQQVYQGATLEPDDQLSADYPQWLIKSTYSGASGFFGAIYVNSATRQMVVAYRGTNSFAALVEDVRGVVLSGQSPQKKEAFSLTKTALALLQKPAYKDYHLSFTGHSLGGFLAELCVFYCPSSFEYHGPVNAVTFESPGVKTTLEKLGSNLEPIALTGLDIIGYVTYPNLINTFDKHIGTLYSLMTDLGQWGDWSGWYTKQAHSMDNIVAYLQNADVRPIYLTDWPTGIKSTQRDAFFKAVNFTKDSHQYVLKQYEDLARSNEQQFKLDFTAHYHTDLVLSERRHLPLKHFAPPLQLFLKAFYACLLNANKESALLTQLRNQWQAANIPARITAFLLGGYQIETRKSGVEIISLQLQDISNLANVDVATFRREVSTWLSESGKSIPELLSIIEPPKKLLSIVAAVVAEGATLAEGAKVKGNAITILNSYLPPHPSEADIMAAERILKEFKTGVGSITAYVIAPGVHVPKGAEVPDNTISIGNAYIGQQPSGPQSGLAQLMEQQRRHDPSSVLSGQPPSAPQSARAVEPESSARVHTNVPK